MILPGPPTGIGPMAAWAARLLAAINSFRIRPGNGYRVRETTTGTILEIDAHGGGAVASGVSMYHLKSVFDDYLACVTWDGAKEGTTIINIAKPEELRTSRPGPETKLSAAYTYTYSVGPDANNLFRTSHTSGLPDEIQLVTPPWIVGSTIDAQSGKTSAKDATGKAISILAISPARIWAKVS